MRLLIATFVIFIIITGTPIVKPQETHSAAQFIGYAQNETYNFNFNAKQYWFNLSQQVLFQSFSDIQDARNLIGIAQSYVGKNETLALMWASGAAYEAKGANYRLFVYLTASVLRDANQTVYSVPSYIAKPTDAVDNLNKAIQLNRTAIVYMGFFPSDPERTWQVLDAMQRSIGQLWDDQNSVASLARLAKKEALDYLAQQTPIKQQEIAGEFASLRSSSYQVAILLVLSLVVAAPTFFLLSKRRVHGWFGRLIDLKLLIGAAVSVGGAAGSLLYLLSELYYKLGFYQLIAWKGMPLAETLAYSVIPLAIVAIVFVIFNGAMSQHKLFTGLVAIFAYVLAFFALLSAWGMTFMFLSFGTELQLGTLDIRDLVALVGAFTGIFSLFLHWYRGRPRLEVEAVGSDHKLVSASNFSGTTVSLGLRIKNTSDTATSVFKVDMTTKTGTEEMRETFELGVAPSESFPYVGRGVMILGHEIVEVPVFFNFPGVNFPQRQTCSVQIWHTHGCVRIPIDSILKA